jgi:hypothetical protein
MAAKRRERRGQGIGGGSWALTYRGSSIERFLRIMGGRRCDVRHCGDAAGLVLLRGTLRSSEVTACKVDLTCRFNSPGKAVAHDEGHAFHSCFHQMGRISSASIGRKQPAVAFTFMYPKRRSCAALPCARYHPFERHFSLRYLHPPTITV